MIHELNSSF
uniref:Uncharacterized protein n=1 Tax=Arundo donax TaxID=35708 RepID=A0A0A9SA57_ARUDO